MKALKRDVALYLTVVSALFLYYVYMILARNAGGDLMLRVCEARYFLRGINPFYVYTGEVGHVAIPCSPHAYSFVSYFLMAPMTLIASETLVKLCFAVLDIACLTISFLMMAEVFDEESDWRIFSASATFLLISVFFWQHVQTLNYNVVSLFFVVLYFFSEKKGVRSLGIMSLVALGVKPSLAIPLLVYVLVARRWVVLSVACASYMTLLLISSLLMSTPVLSIPLQILRTQQSFSVGGTDGVLLLLKPLAAEYMAILSLLFVVVVTVGVRNKATNRGVFNFFIVIVLGLSLFYNHVHAWIVALPMLVFSMFKYREKRRLFIVAGLPVLLFLLVPRLAGMVPEVHRQVYYMVHNVFRFSLLYFSLCAIYVFSFRKPEMDESYGALRVTADG